MEHAQVIDHHRPWIRDERDDPAEMNWVQTLFNPFGRTSKLHFSRAWTFMFMGRVLLFIVPVFVSGVVSMAGVDTSAAWKPVEALILPIPALLVAFFVFTIVTEFTSWIAHIRRLADAHRSTLKAMIVLIPLILALGGFTAGAMGGIQQFRAKQAEVAQAADGEAAGTSETAAPQPQARGGRRGPPPTERQVAIGGGMGLAMPIWAVSSFFVMLWSLLHVARLPNGGVGPIRTGSDMTAAEAAGRA